jgi:cystathionine beta-lyase
MTRTPKHLDTLLQHTGIAPFDPDTGMAPVSLPSMRTSTVRFRDLDALDSAYRRRAAGERVVTYGRAGMDTHVALEDVFKHLEHGSHCFLASSGVAGIALAFMGLLSAGDHALVADCVYGPVRELYDAMLSRQGIEVTYFPSSADARALEALVRPNTRLLYAESPGSLLFQMMDMPMLAAFAKRHGLALVSDNTWGSGYAYRPLELGAQVSVISGTKYVSGHSDVMLGAVVVNDDELAKRIRRAHYALGYSISADDAWLALRGVRTLPVRMPQSARHAMQVCEFLAQRPEIGRIYHPAWPADPGHALWKRDASGSNGMLAVSLRLPPEAGRRFVNALTLYGIGYSWGGFESLVQLVSPSVLAHHSYWTEGERACVRLHIGLEDPRDLVDDLAQALDRARA